MRVRLFVASLALVILVGVPASIFLEGKLRGWVKDQVVAELSANIRALYVALEDVPSEKLQPLITAYGKALDSRVTVINEKGRVLADSGVAEDLVAAIENHANRPEVQEAYKTGLGIAQRMSSTVGFELLYVAIANKDTVIRLAAPLPHVDTAVAHSVLFLGYQLIFLVAAIFLGLASSLASHRL